MPPAAGMFLTTTAGFPGMCLPMNRARNRPYRSYPPPTPDGPIIEICLPV